MSLSLNTSQVISQPLIQFSADQSFQKPASSSGATNAQQDDISGSGQQNTQQSSSSIRAAKAIYAIMTGLLMTSVLSFAGLQIARGEMVGVDERVKTAVNAFEELSDDLLPEEPAHIAAEERTVSTEAMQVLFDEMIEQGGINGSPYTQEQVETFENLLNIHQDELLNLANTYNDAQKLPTAQELFDDMVEVVRDDLSEEDKAILEENKEAYLKLIFDLLNVENTETIALNIVFGVFMLVSAGLFFKAGDEYSDAVAVSKDSVASQ